jgi:hypothetical protein
MLLILASCTKPASAPLPISSTPSIAGQIAQIKLDLEKRQAKFYADLRASHNDMKIVSQLSDEWYTFQRKQAQTLQGLVKDAKRPEDAFNAIVILTRDIQYDLTDDQARLLLEQHLNNPGIGSLCFYVRVKHVPATEQFLKGVIARHTNPAVRGQALYALGDYYGPRTWASPPREAEESQKLADAAKCYREVVDRYAEYKTPDGRARLGDNAARELVRIANLPLLKVGKVAPEITGADLDGKPFKLSDYRGKVILLDFWGHW